MRTVVIITVQIVVREDIAKVVVEEEVHLEKEDIQIMQAMVIEEVLVKVTAHPIKTIMADRVLSMITKNLQMGNLVEGLQVVVEVI
jgi:hypothetical protein